MTSERDLNSPEHNQLKGLFSNESPRIVGGMTRSDTIASLNNAFLILHRAYAEVCSVYPKLDKIAPQDLEISFLEAEYLTSFLDQQLHYATFLRYADGFLRSKLPFKVVDFAKKRDEYEYKLWRQDVDIFLHRR